MLIYTSIRAINCIQLEIPSVEKNFGKISRKSINEIVYLKAEMGLKL